MRIGARWDASGPTGEAGTDKAFSLSKLMAGSENVRTQAKQLPTVGGPDRAYCGLRLPPKLSASLSQGIRKALATGK
jgi:hypothetical protein